jgi:hypothetical protein
VLLDVLLQETLGFEHLNLTTAFSMLADIREVSYQTRINNIVVKVQSVTEISIK